MKQKKYSKECDDYIIKIYKSGVTVPTEINKKYPQYSVCHIATVIERHNDQKQPEWLRKIIAPKSANQVYAEASASVLEGSIPYPSKAQLMAGR